MVLLLSDTHLGLKTGSDEQAVEKALVAFLKSFENKISHLYLVGDIFDAFIEYKHLVPKGFVRFMALLSEWTDRGISITYVVGNHDPWHFDFFQKELGIRVINKDLYETVCGTPCYIRHGDNLSPKPWQIRTLLRNPFLVWLYRAAIPAQWGFALAKWVSRHFHNRTPDPSAAKTISNYAHHKLRTTDAKLIVMGHCHQAKLSTWESGTYINLGSWRTGGHAGILVKGRIQLVRSQSGNMEIVNESTL